MDPGFYTAEELSNEEYHRGPGVSNSGLKLIGSKTPAHYYAQYRDPNAPERKAGRPQMIGTAIHAAALEPDKFDAEYVVAEEFIARNAKGFKAWASEQRRHILMPAEYGDVIGMRKSLHAHPIAGNLLADAQEFEYSAYAEDPETGILCRVRLDLLTQSGWIVDLKKCQDASPEGAAKAIANYGYYHQAAFYLDVWTMATGGDAPMGFAFIFVEEQYPHAVGVYVLSDGHDEAGNYDPLRDDIGRGRKEYRRNLSIYAHCERNDYWPGYAPRAVELELPYWQRRKIDEKLEDDL